MPQTATALLRVGLIGAGRVGRIHADLLARQVPEATLAAVFDVHAAAAQHVGAALGVPVAGGLEELLEDPDVDAVAICTTADTHPELIVAAARAGKAILCEKPVSLDLAVLDAALEEVRACGVPFQIGFNRRFDPAHRAVREAVATGRIGEPHLVRISSRDPAPPSLDYVRTSGGMFLDMTVHDFDMASFVTGSAVVEVYARGAVRVDPAFADAGDVDTALVLLVHASGCLTAIDNSRRSVYGYDQRVEVFGAGGTAASENPLVHTGAVRTAAGTTTPNLPHFFPERYVPSYVAGWRSFAAAVAAGTAPAAGGDDARAALVVGLAAGRSLRDGRSVRVSEVDTA